MPPQQELQPVSAPEPAPEPLAAADAPPAAAELPPAEPAAPAAAPASALPSKAVRVLTAEERILLEQNQRIRSLNRAPDDFPAFIRKGYDVQAHFKFFISLLFFTNHPSTTARPSQRTLILVFNETRIPWVITCNH